ncbi:unnamed protein product [Prorocentrum cordatum]|uniref:Uncharacterized protein n=1 Tax=Prorocentrum cordatum TaxID=2364126 RepID=A0ABN9WZD8_9DINO|nr:unnamed protein product [Polarella glacialis]
MAIGKGMMAQIQAMLDANCEAITKTLKDELQTSVAGLPGQISAQGTDLQLMRSEIAAQATITANLETKGSTCCGTSVSFLPSAGSSCRQALEGGSAWRVQHDDEGGEPTIKFIGTYPRPLLMKTRMAHWQQLQSLFPELKDESTVTPIFHGVSQVYKLKFTRAADAQIFQLKLNQTCMEWVDFRGKSRHSIRVRGDHPFT